MQIEALKRAGVHPDQVHIEKRSASDKRRPVLEWAIETLRPGDTLVVWKFDRIARSMQDMLDKMTAIKDAGAGFRSLTEQVDTTTPGGVFLMHMLAAAAQFERDLIKQRTKAGVEAAQRRGVKFGQPRKMSDHEELQCAKWRFHDGKPIREIVDLVKEKFKKKVSHQTVMKRTNKLLADGKIKKRRKPKRKR